ncbi:MAG: DNA polymerase III subunit gamma/tau [Oscillospiraceae bacterium]|jgi:DNA polymerase-3 subunit gamma/tau|nr:DNA polymerase III subunit gamma/tau [Oscillospiraceae bacterium]
MSMALYRKYRPLVFRDVIGQRSVTDTLRRQVASGKTSHAYLFTGTRGTGKTTCAKILARAVNCENPKDGDPCNVCPACKSILGGGATDVLEMDAASHSGVDNIRALREEFVYTPVSLKKRVYIIDEVHMLSTGAFNALLKSMEEPPEHVVFILATTETHKVPATILSRCQRYAFRRLTAGDLKAQLLDVAAKENIELDADAADLLARMADGASRDALSLLDQCAALSDGFPVDAPLVHEALGLSGTLEIAEWLTQMAARDVPAALRTLDALYQNGKELSSLLDACSSLLRDVLMAHMLADPASSARLDADTLKSLANALSPQRLIYMITALQNAQQRLPKSVNKRIEAELCVMRLCDMSAPEDAAPRREERPARPPADEQPPRRDDRPARPPDEEPPSPRRDDRPGRPPADEPDASPAPQAGSAELAFEIREKSKPLYRAFLDGATAELTPGGVVLSARDEFCAMNLKTEEFLRFLNAEYPGQARVKVREPSSGSTDKLKGLLASAGALITLDDD